MALDNMASILEKLAAFNAGDELREIVEDNGERLVELQQEQLAAGQDKDGQSRTDQYAISTVQMKQKNGVGLGAVTDRVTFFNVGNLYQSLRTNVSQDQFMVNSPLPTFDYMINRVGEENYGLSPDQREEFATEITAPQIKERFHDKVFT